MAEGWQDIYNLNKQKIGNNPNFIKQGTVLKMPDGSRYKVKPGDNLSSIAKTSGTKSTPAKSNNLNTKPAVEPKYYSLPPDAAATRSLTLPAKTPAAQDDSPYVFDPRSGKIGVNPSGIADVFRNTALPPPLTRDEIEQQMMQPDLAGPAAPGFRHTVQGPEGKEYDFDSEQEARDFVDRIKQLDIKDRESQGLGAAKSESIRYKKGMAEDNAINVPLGQQATTQPDGSTRISKIGSVSRADYAKNMAAYKAQTQTPAKIADFKQRMASGQGYTDTERQANLQQQQQHFGKFADTGDLDEGDGFDDITTFSDMRTTDRGGKTNQTYTSTTIAKNPTTGQQQSLGRWDHTDPKTGKNYSGTSYIDPQGNADVQKNYKESQDQLDELDKKTVASWVRQQPQRIKGATGLSRTNFKKAKRLVDKSIPSAIAKYKDPSYGKQEPRLDEVSLGKYREKAMADKALAQANKFFGRDDPATVAAADRTIAKRERGLGRADARSRPYTAPPVDQDKQRRDLADKYPNIDELVRQAELRRDPNYEYADGPAYYDGRDAEHNYHRLKQIQRMIRGAELDEMDFGGVSQTKDSTTGDVTTNFNQGPLSVSQTKTPGGYTKQTDQQFNLGTATLGARTVGPNIGAGQLAGTTTKTATNTATGQAKQQVKGVGFGGATGATVGKNYVGSSDDELAKLAADSATGINESVERMKHLAGIKQSRV
jgi:LysM repeat protein